MKGKNIKADKRSVPRKTAKLPETKSAPKTKIPAYALICIKTPKAKTASIFLFFKRAIRPKSKIIKERAKGGLIRVDIACWLQNADSPLPKTQANDPPK